MRESEPQGMTEKFCVHVFSVSMWLHLLKQRSLIDEKPDEKGPAEPRIMTQWELL